MGFFTKQKKELSSLEQEFYSKKKKLEEKFSIAAKFTNELEEFKVDFEIGEEWQLLKVHSNGHIEFRCFSSDAKELINGQEKITKSAQNFWRKGSFVKTHYHTEADEYIYLVHGVLEILTKNKDGSFTENTYDSLSKQPILIKAGTYHFIKCLAQASFVTKFVFI